MYFRSYGLQKALLDKNLKSSASEDTSPGSKVHALKHCFNFNGSSLTIFIDQCEGN